MLATAFYCRRPIPYTLPVYKGSTFHGGFGHALKRIGRRFRDYFFAPPAFGKDRKRKALPKPFMLIPPLEEKTRYLPGDEMSCGLILFGVVLRHFMIAFAAVECLGQDLGLGMDQGRFRITAVVQLTLKKPLLVFVNDTWYPKPKPICVREVLNAHQADGRRITLSLATRLRLKNNNLLVRKPPQFAVLFDRILGRINSLAALYGSGILLPQQDKHRMVKAAAAVDLDLDGTTARWVDWTRPSKKGKGEMSFGGLLGDISYVGDLKPFIPWLSLGQWTGVGGKTSFGLGTYQMEINA